MSIAYETVRPIAVAARTTRTRHRFSLEDYEQMIEFGILAENDRVELIRGEIVEKMTIGEPHAACVMRFNHLFSQLIGDRAIVGVQSPVVVAESRPEPDLSLLAVRNDFYSESAPRPADILLLIEVADSSLEYDRTEKLSLYAEAGVREYWIANLNDQCVEVYRAPLPNGTYADSRVRNLGETLDIAALPGMSIAVDHVFRAKRDL